jgi:hypothetical protein
MILDDIADFTDRFTEKWTEEILGTTGFVFERSRFDASFFIANKNYLLLDPKGNLIVHGSGLKGIHRPQVTDIVLADAAGKLLRGVPVIAKKYFDWSQYPLEAYLMRRTMGKELHEYAPHDLSAKLARQYLSRGLQAERGTILEYYSSTTGLRAYFSEDPISIDFDDYGDRIRKLLNALGIDENSHYTLQQTVERVNRLEAAAHAGLTEDCLICGGKGSYRRKGQILMEKCTCENGKRLVVA